MWKGGETISLGMDFLQFHARMASLPLPARLDASSSLGLPIPGREIPGLPPSPNKVSPSHGRASPRHDMSRTASCLPTLALNSGLNAINLMQTVKHGHLKLPPYSSPPPTANHPEHNVCKLVEFRGAKIAAFTVDSRELICLPQAFELFLKHLVGGLHTVYTKLKRLEIIPVVCNVEQVRILRGLGAIQPGVNRCKLISCAEFETLYDDCTNSNARPGRPAKRLSSVYPVEADVLESLKRRREGISADISYNQGIYDRDPRLQTTPGVGGYPSMTHFSNLFSMHHILQPMALRPHIEARPTGEGPQTDSRGAASGRIPPRSDGDILPMLEMYSRLSAAEGRLPHCHPALGPASKPLNLQVNGYEKEESRVLASDDDNDDDDDDNDCNVDDNIVSDEDKRDKGTDDSSSSDCYSNNNINNNSSNNSNNTHNSKVTERPSVSDLSTHFLPLLGDQRFSDFESLVTTFNTVVRSLVDAARTVERRISDEKDQLSAELEREKERCLELERVMQAERQKREFFQRRARRLRRALGCESASEPCQDRAMAEQLNLESSSEQMIVSTQGLCSASDNEDSHVTDSSLHEDGVYEDNNALRRGSLEAMNSPSRMTHTCDGISVLQQAVPFCPTNN